MPRRISPIPCEPMKKKKPASNLIIGELKQGELISDNTGRKWKLGKAIGIGGFGEIYDVTEHMSSENSDNEYVAKIEKHRNGPLFVEINCYLRLGKLKTIDEWKKEKGLNFLGLPHFVASGSHSSKDEKYRFLILPKYDKDLEAVFQTKRIFNLKTVLVIASRIIDTLEYIHSHGYVHSDIKASNIMLGSIQTDKRRSSRTRNPVKRYSAMSHRKNKPIARPLMKFSTHNLRPVTNLNYIDDIPYLEEVLIEYEATNLKNHYMFDDSKSSKKQFEGDCVYLLDYGLASKFLLSNGEHREFCSDQRRAHAGTVLFCSRDAHKGIPSRRSDLESLAYNMIYWLTGTLPWVEDVHEPELVEKKKTRCFTDVKTFLGICFEDCPKFLVEIFMYLSELQFMDNPNYDFFRQLFKKTIHDYGYKDDSKLDFDNLEGWGRKQKKISSMKNNKKENKKVCKLPTLLLYSPLKPLSSNIIFRRPKLRKKIKDNLANNSMMNWSKILIMDPETVIRQATHRRNPEDERIFSISESDLESLNPTPAMWDVFNRASEREERSPSSSRGDEICVIDAIEGYTSEMMRVHRRMIEQKQLELETAAQQSLLSKRRYRKRTKRSDSPPKFSSRTSKTEVSSSQHALRKPKSISLKRTYSLRG